MAQPALSLPGRSQVQFGPYVVDLRSGELCKGGIRVKLQERPFQILALLLAHAGESVSREEIRSRLWPDGTIVDFDNNISSAVGKLRAALCDSAAEPRYIETVGRRGYRFIAEVKWLSPPASVAPQVDPLPPAVAAPEAARELPPARPARHGKRWVVVAFSALLLVASAALFAGYKGWPLRSRGAAPANKVMLAVLPFTNLTGNAGQEYFSDGFTEEMVAQLGRIDPDHLGVIARTSVMQYKNNPKPLSDVAHELGVRYLIEGSVRRDANKLRITAQLIDGRDQTHLWAREYDRNVTDLLQVQQEIAQNITDEILSALHPPKRAAVPVVRRPRPTNYEAYDLYLQGRYLWNKRTREGFQQALDAFQKSIARDPGYAPSYAGIADSYALLSTYGYGEPDEYMSRARAAALRALQLDEQLAEAHVSLALITETYDWDAKTAEKEFRRAIELNPNYATAHHWYAEFLGFEGRFDEALAEIERARELDPLSIIIAVDRGAILFYARRHDLAVQQLVGVTDVAGDVPRALSILACAYAELGRFDDALRVVAKLEKSGSSPWISTLRAQVLFKKGDRSAAARLVARSENELRGNQLDAVRIRAVNHAIAGDVDGSVAWLDHAYAAHSNIMVTLNVDPVFDSIRSDARFQDLLRRVHFQE